MTNPLRNQVGDSAEMEFKCRKCGNVWWEPMELDRGFPHTWMPVKDMFGKIPCPKCGHGAHERLPTDPVPPASVKTLEDWWEWMLEQEILRLDPLRDHPVHPAL